MCIRDSGGEIDLGERPDALVLARDRGPHEVVDVVEVAEQLSLIHISEPTRPY